MQRELAEAMTALARSPVVMPGDVTAALENGDDVLSQGEVIVRIDRENMSLSDLNQVWSAFQSEYHLAAFYRVAVALIEVETPPPPAQPVLRRNIDAGPSAAPTVGAPTLPGGKPAAFPGESVSLPASGVLPNSFAWFGLGDDINAVAGSVPIEADDDVVRFIVPDANPTPAVPGVVAVRVAPAAAGEPPRPDPLRSSAAIPLRIAARIDAIVQDGAGVLFQRDGSPDPGGGSINDGGAGTEPTVVEQPTPTPAATSTPPASVGSSLLSGISVPGTSGPAAADHSDTAAAAGPEPSVELAPAAAAVEPTVRVDLTPRPAGSQSVSLYLRPIGGDPAKSFERPRLPRFEDVRFSIERVPPGRYIARVRVDGVESAPDQLSDPPRFVEIEL